MTKIRQNKRASPTSTVKTSLYCLQPGSVPLAVRWVGGGGGGGGGYVAPHRFVRLNKSSGFILSQ